MVRTSRVEEKKQKEKQKSEVLATLHMTGETHIGSACYLLIKVLTRIAV